MTRLVLVVHILAVATWLGCNVAQAFMGGLIGNASPETRIWYSEAGEKMAKIVYNVAGILVLATGLEMVIRSAPDGKYSFQSTFVSIGLAAVIIGAALGITVFAPKNRALAQAVRDGDEEQEKRLRKTIMGFGLLDTLIVVATVGFMVFRTGAKFR